MLSQARLFQMFVESCFCYRIPVMLGVLDAHEKGSVGLIGPSGVELVFRDNGEVFETYSGMMLVCYDSRPMLWGQQSLSEMFAWLVDGES